MIAPEKITTIMGLPDEVHSLYELNNLIIQGLPKDCLLHTVEQLSSSSKIRKHIQNRLVPASTFRRRNVRLNVDESERVERIARIYAESLDLWGNQKDAQNFLFHSHPELNNRTPIDISITPLGALQVEQIINNIRYGLPI